MNLEEKKSELLMIAKDWYKGNDKTDGISDLDFDQWEANIKLEDPSWNYRDHLEMQGETIKHYDTMTKVNKFQETERGMDEVSTEVRSKKGLVDSPKLDGGGIILYYSLGVLYDALTRSSQTEGKCQFDKIKKMVPRIIANKKITSVECEAVVDLKHGFGNLSRQKATGLLNSNSKQEECERYLTVVAFKTRYKKPVDLEIWKVDLANLPAQANDKNVTFTPSPLGSGSYKGNKFIGQVQGNVVNYLMDGIVVHFTPYGPIHDEYLKANRIKKGADSVAHKIYYNDKKPSTVTNIEWNLTLSALKYVPKYIYNTVNLDGTDCSRATAGGTAQLKKMKCGIGAEVEVIKAGLTIPQVYRPVSELVECELRLGVKGDLIDLNCSNTMSSILKLYGGLKELNPKFSQNEVGDVFIITYTTDAYTDASIKKIVDGMIAANPSSIELYVETKAPHVFNTSEDYGLPVKCECGTDLTWFDELNGGLYCSNDLCTVNEGHINSLLTDLGKTLVELIITDPIKFITSVLKAPRFGGASKLKPDPLQVLSSSVNKKGQTVDICALYTVDSYASELIANYLDMKKITFKYFNLSGLQIEVMDKFIPLVINMISKEVKP